MADLPSHPDTQDGPGDGDDRGPTIRAARGVPALGLVVAIAMVMILVVLHLTGAIGPSSH